jgi:hypothetical protein
MTMETKREVLVGFAYPSGNGQLVIDYHPTDEQHLNAEATHLIQPMYRCRTYVRDLLPPEWLNKRGKFFVDRQVTQQGEVMAVQISFVPEHG